MTTSDNGNNGYKLTIDENENERKRHTTVIPDAVNMPLEPKILEHIQSDGQWHIQTQLYTNENILTKHKTQKTSAVEIPTTVCIHYFLPISQFSRMSARCETS